jgi:hypothetical protein
MPAGEDGALAGFSPAAEHPFSRDGERRVSKAVALWFRNGACAGDEVFRGANRRQLKIYSESNRSDFSQIFARLTAMQILALYRGLLLVD